jgi:hypothetical protein
MTFANKLLLFTRILARSAATASLLPLALLVGCVANTAEGQPGDDEPVASASQALNGTPATYTWEGTLGGIGGPCGSFKDGVNNWVQLSGVDSSWQCFVSGVLGNTTSGGVSVGFYTTPFCGVADGWILSVNGAPGATVGGRVTCIPATGTGATESTTPAPRPSRRTSTRTPSAALLSSADRTGRTSQASRRFRTLLRRARPPLRARVAGHGTRRRMFRASIRATRRVPRRRQILPGTFNNNSLSDGVSLTRVNSTTWNVSASAGKTATFYCVD